MSKVEVFLDQDQIKNLKSILDQSQVGIHLLFDNQMIARVFKSQFTEDDFFDVENLKKVQKNLLELLQMKTLLEKQDYIRSLSMAEQDQVVRAYFYIIENNIKQSKQLTH